MPLQNLSLFNKFENAPIKLEKFILLYKVNFNYNTKLN